MVKARSVVTLLTCIFSPAMWGLRDRTEYEKNPLPEVKAHDGLKKSERKETLQKNRKYKIFHKKVKEEEKGEVEDHALAKVIREGLSEDMAF